MCLLFSQFFFFLSFLHFISFGDNIFSFSLISAYHSVLRCLLLVAINITFSIISLHVFFCIWNVIISVASKEIYLYRKSSDQTLSNKIPCIEVDNSFGSHHQISGFTQTPSFHSRRLCVLLQIVGNISMEIWCHCEVNDKTRFRKRKQCRNSEWPTWISYKLRCWWIAYFDFIECNQWWPMMLFLIKHMRIIIYN